MKNKLEQIFALKKTTFDAPSQNASTGSFEQDVLFIEIEEAPCIAKNGKITARVTGSLVVYAQVDKLPYGYFQKRIQLAGHELTKDFFFFNVDLNPPNSPAKVQNISERRVRFVYLYESQFDPEHGELTSLEGI